MQAISYYKNLSISTKLAMWYGLSLLLMLSLFGYFLYETFHQSIHHNYDRHLRFEAEQLLPFINYQNDSLRINLEGYGRNEALKGGIQYGTYVRLYDKNGPLIFESPNFSGTDEPLETVLPSENTEFSLSREWQNLPSRTLYYPILLENKQLNSVIGWLEMTGFEWTLHEEVTRFRQYLLILIIISAGFSILSGYWLSKKALSPVSSITMAVKSITATDLDKRVPVNYKVRDELTDLAETFNLMINRLKKGFEREKRFTSDAAHELMTPLASLRSEAEIILRKPRTNEVYKDTIEVMLSEIIRVSEMLHLLLQFARVESEQQYQKELINFSRIIGVVLERKNGVWSKKNIQLVRKIEPDLFVLAHAAYLEEVVNNLIENAFKYTHDGGEVHVQLNKSGKDLVVLHVKDDGIGFDQETGEHLFERFYRSKQIEVQDQAGSGLGLPLVKAIVEQYGGSVQGFSGGLEKGSSFMIKLPLTNS